MKMCIKLFICLWILVTHSAFGCTLVVMMPVSKFDPLEYVFIGEVVQYVGPTRSKYVLGEAWGVLIKARQSVHSPKIPNGYFEVYPFDMAEDCSSLGRSKKQLSEDYPLGSKVFVIAKESKVDAAGVNNIRLNIIPGSNDLLTRTTAQQSLPSGASIYDYRSYREAQTVLPLLELRKDLLKLRDASSLEDASQCILVIIGATAEGNKELLAMSDGYRESAESWKELLLDLKQRRLTIDPKVAVGDGALGFWKALPQVFGNTREQRCWVHKTANVLNKLPKGLQAKAKADLHEIWMAESRTAAEQAIDHFLTTYEVKYAKAAECLAKDRSTC